MSNKVIERPVKMKTSYGYSNGYNQGIEDSDKYYESQISELNEKNQFIRNQVIDLDGAVELWKNTAERLKKEIIESREAAAERNTEISELEEQLKEKGWDDEMHKSGRNKWHDEYLKARQSLNDAKEIFQRMYGEVGFELTSDELRKIIKQLSE